MNKESYYFQHDYEPTSDPKIAALLSEFGAEGYGIFWRIIEMLHSNIDHKIPKKEYIYLALAKQLITNDNKIKLVIEFATNVCELFLDNSDFIISKRVLQNFEKRQDLFIKRSEAGKAGMQSRWASDNKRITNDNFAITKDNKNNKGKERKEKKKSISPFGFLNDNPGEFTGIKSGTVL